MKSKQAIDNHVDSRVSVMHPCTLAVAVAICFDRELLEMELEAVGIRLNKRRPNIYFKVS